MRPDQSPGDPEREPITGLPIMPERAGPGPGQRIRIIGLIAGVLLVLGAAAYFFSGQQFTTLSIVLLALAAAAALIQSGMVVYEIIRDRR